MKAIWKYQLELTDKQEIFMPKGATILTVQVQDGTPCLWAEVNTEAGTVSRIIETIGTGRLYHNHTDRKYIGTYQMLGGKPMWHVFEELSQL